MTDYNVMKVRRVATAEEAGHMIGDTVPERGADLPKNTLVYDEDTGELVAAYLAMDGMGALRRSLRSLKMGTLGRARNYASKSSTFGFAPRRPVRMREACSTTSITTNKPDVQSALDDVADRSARLFRTFAPGVVEADQAALEGILPEWKMGEEKLWTSGVVNDTAQLPYHRDNFNYPVWSAMPVLRRGTRGGHLHIPEYDLVIPCQDSTVSYFLGKELVHGVTPITNRGGDAYRYSVVFYALRGMKDCYTHAVETAYGQRKRTERQRDIARRLAAGETGIPGHKLNKPSAPEDADSAAQAVDALKDNT